MTIQVKFFASLREQQGQAEILLTATETLHSVADVWQAVNQQRPLPQKLLIAVNQVYASLETAVHDGDEVAFFPPVTGG